jgi:predicted AlkP superfamily pyrophosphatase or phosphodiesterase
LQIDPFLRSVFVVYEVQQVAKGKPFGRLDLAIRSVGSNDLSLSGRKVNKNVKNVLSGFFAILGINRFLTERCMRKLFIFCISFAQIFGAMAQRTAKVERPKLVVGIVIDQMRWDYLYRYYDLYRENGFKRLMNDGFNCQNTMINYLPSFTAPGHACIYTGSVPSIHGIAANDFVDNYSCTSTYCVDDRTVRRVLEGDTGIVSMSPRNLLASTITDELRLATNFKSRVYGVAVKDRASIIPAGHLANGAYWFDDSTGNFQSSTYYKEASPSWLRAFNKRRTPDSLVAQNWNLLYPANQYDQSIVDNNIYEHALKGESAPVFPHNVSMLKGRERYEVIKKIPAGNTLTFQAAKACMEGTGLGKGSDPDFLCVSLSSSDYVGHQFAPNSIEVEDMYLRLDADLAAFLDYLDKSVGKGNYLLFLTADHGAAHNPQYLIDEKMPAGFLSTHIKDELNAYLKPMFNRDDIVSYFINYQVYFNDTMIRTTHRDREKIKDAVITYFKTKPEIGYVVDMENMSRAPLPELIHTMVVNGYCRGRSGAIEVIPNPGWFEGYGVAGTTHGTWHPYDTHIPLLWYGWHIPKGETHTVVNMTDIAPTLAALLHIQMPNGCIGKPVVEIVDGKK